MENLWKKLRKKVVRKQGTKIIDKLCLVLQNNLLFEPNNETTREKAIRKGQEYLKSKECINSSMKILKKGEFGVKTKFSFDYKNEKFSGELVIER